MTAGTPGPPPGKLVGAAMLPPLKQAAGPKPKPAARVTGRFAEINTFIDYTMGGLTPSARSVWLILWRDTKPNGLARTSQVDLARRADVTDRAVRTALAELAAAGLVTVVARGGVSRGASTYRVRGANPSGASNRKPASGDRRKGASGGRGSPLPPSQNGTTSGGR